MQGSTIELTETVIYGIEALPKQRFKGVSQLFLITDRDVAATCLPKCKAALEAAGLPLHVHTVPSGEAAKTVDVAIGCWQAMLAAGCDRHAMVIGLGGGAITDLSGFVASCFMRGVKSLLIPTTLLGMVDAAIGGKTAIDLPEGKNLVGSFHPPEVVLVETSFLSSLPAAELTAGLAEIIKIAVIMDPELFTTLEAQAELLSAERLDLLLPIIRRSIDLKQQVVALDLQETAGVRHWLNYGHTFAHAIEAATEFKTYRHGEAVAIGMSCAAYLAEELEAGSEELRKRIESLCRKVSLPTKLPALSTGQLLEIMKRDKKNRAGEITCIIAKEIGKVVAMPCVSEQSIANALERKLRLDNEALPQA